MYNPRTVKFKRKSSNGTADNDMKSYINVSSNDIECAQLEAKEK